MNQSYWIIGSAIGGIAGVNSGTIYECEINGEINVTFETNVLAQINNDLTKDYKFTFGIIAGENEGIIDSCNISGNTYMNYILSSEVSGAFNNLDSITSFGIANNNTIIVSGGLVGINKNQIINCTNNTKYVSNNSFTTNIGGINKGQAYLNVKLYDGALVGINEKDIINCTSVVKNNNIHTSNDDYYKEFDQLNIIVVQRLTQIIVTDYTVYDKYAGIIGYSKPLSTITNLNN